MSAASLGWTIASDRTLNILVYVLLKFIATLYVEATRAYFF